MMTSSALFLFAPKFCEFGVDIATALVESGFVSTVDCICTGGHSVTSIIRAGLSGSAGEIIDIEAEELLFDRNPMSREALEEIENSLPRGAFGRIITADRRVGAGLVLGGSTRPSQLKALALARPYEFPSTYCARLLQFLSALLDRTAPRFIFLYADASAISVALSELARLKNIPVYRMASARIGSRMLIDVGPPGLLESARLYASDANSSIRDFDRCYAAEALAEFRRTSAPPDASAFVAKRDSWKRLPGILARAALVTGRVALVSSWRRDPDRWTPVLRAWHEASNGLKRLFASNRYLSRDFPENRRIVYFPLHVDPEASTMVLAPYHTNQIAVIEALAKALPADAILVVKEHRPMKGLRPRGFYKTIASMPRVVLLSPDIDGLDCVKRADLTAVITGTAAWEAVRLGKPALVVGNSPYLQIGEGIVHEPCLAKLPEAMKKALEIPPARDETLIAFLAALHAATFDLKTSLLWGKYLDHSEQERSEATRAVVEKLLALIDVHDKAKASSSHA